MTARWMVFLGIGSALGMGGAATVRAATATPAADQCSLTDTYHISAVTPYRAVDHTVPTHEEAELKGVVLRVDAQPGLTKEWLQRTFEKSVAARECGLGAEPVSVDVQSDGDAFQVQLTTDSRKGAADLLHRMQQMAG